MNTQKAIEKAKEGGYEPEGIYVSSYFLDPLFWQSLGKALVWAKYDRSVTYYSSHKILKNRKAKVSPIKGEVHTENSYLYHWHRFIDTLAEGGTAEDYFTNLLK